MLVGRSLIVCLLLGSLASPGLMAQQAASQEERWKTDPRLSEGQIAPILEGLGNHSHPVTASSPRVQRFFDQGLALIYGFNHAEAIRAFKEAARLDPTCAMAYWGLALANGPNINSPMGPEAGNAAYEAIQKALELASGVSEEERGYIEALAQRYAEDPEAERLPLDEAYADAMNELSRRYPDDPDAVTLWAASIMNIDHWAGHEYWNKDGSPRPGTTQFVGILENVMRRFPDHAGANHYYIHAVEASQQPDLAVPSAEKLGALMPGAGHLVHMPSHIFIRVGRYADASVSNELAIEADESYITQCSAQGIYPLGYYPHNIHFLWASASREGRSQVAIDAALKVASKVGNADNDAGIGFRAPALTVLVRFGKWDEILALEAPPPGALGMRGMHHFARGMAYRALDRLDAAEAELRGLEDTLDGDLSDSSFSANSAEHILTMARHVLAGEIAARRGDFEKAVSHLDTAVRYDDGLVYTEPNDWDVPVRQHLGAVLLEADRALEAEVVYWEDLRRNPESGWSLYGLLQSLRSQGKERGAGEIEQRYKEAWRQADVVLTSSRF